MPINRAKHKPDWTLGPKYDPDHSAAKGSRRKVSKGEPPRDPVTHKRIRDTKPEPEAIEPDSTVTINTDSQDLNNATNQQDGRTRSANILAQPLEGVVIDTDPITDRAATSGGNLIQQMESDILSTMPKRGRPPKPKTYQTTGNVFLQGPGTKQVLLNQTNTINAPTLEPNTDKGKYLHRRTVDVRNAFALLLSGNIHKLNSWLNEVAVKDPEKAFRLYLDAAEFCVPKLSRIEHSGSNDEDAAPLALHFVLHKPKEGE